MTHPLDTKAMRERELWREGWRFAHDPGPLGARSLRRMFFEIREELHIPRRQRLARGEGKA